MRLAGSSRVIATCYFWIVVAVLSGPCIAQAQEEMHGTVTDVQDDIIKIQLSDSLTVSSGTTGRIVKVVDVGGGTRRLNIASFQVTAVSEEPGNAVQVRAQVTGRSQDLSQGDQVVFGAVLQRQGRLSIQTTPSSVTVYLDGRKLGVTPLQNTVAAGQRRLRLVKSGYETVVRDVEVPPDLRTSETISLQKFRGTLSVETAPDGAQVQIEGRVVGTTPFQDTLGIGRYQIQLSRDGYENVQRTVAIRRKESTRVLERLQRKLDVQAAGEQPSQVERLRLRRDGERVVILYDLTGDEDEYDVHVLFSSDGGADYSRIEDTVKGDVGEDIPPGQEKRIVWFAVEQFPEGLQGGTNSLKLSVEPPGGRGLLYTIGGTIVAGSVTAAILLFGGSAGDRGGSFPPPPTPPGN